MFLLQAEGTVPGKGEVLMRVSRGGSTGGSTAEKEPHNELGSESVE